MDGVIRCSVKIKVDLEKYVTQLIQRSQLILISCLILGKLKGIFQQEVTMRKMAIDVLNS